MDKKHLWWIGCFVVCLLIAAAGCRKPSSGPVEEKGRRQPQSEVSATPGTIQISTPEVRCVKLGEEEESPSAVCIQGYPLVFTGQVLPEDGGAAEHTLDAEIKLAWGALEAVLEKAGSIKEKIVRLNCCISQEGDAAQVIGFVRRQFPNEWLPAISMVVTPLPREKARIAFDAVAYLEEQPADLKTIRLSGESGRPSDAVICPPGGLVFFSGQPDKSPLPAAAENAIKALLETAENLHVEKKDILQIRVFLQPVSEASTVLKVLEQVFPEGTMPPVIFTEWIASAPIEIEMIARLPQQAISGSDRVRFWNPPGVKPSPTFSRVTIVQTDRLIFLPGFLSRKDGSGQEQVDDIFAQLTEGLKQTGSDFQHLAKATYYVAEKDASDAVDAARKKLYDPDRPPAASKVTIHGVGQAGRTVSVDVIAVPAAGPQ